MLEAGCDYKFIIWLKPYKKPGEMYKDIWIVSSFKEFESILRSLLHIDINKPPYPIAPPIRKWKLGGSFKDFKDLMESLGLSNFLEPVKILLLKILALDEIETQYIQYYPGYKEPFMQNLENPEAIAILKQLGLIGEGSRGTYEDGKTFTASLTEKDKHLAHIIAHHEIENNKEFIESIIKKYGIIILFIASYNRDFFLWQREENYSKVVCHLSSNAVESLSLGTIGF